MWRTANALNLHGIGKMVSQCHWMRLLIRKITFLGERGCWRYLELVSCYWVVWLFLGNWKAQPSLSTCAPHLGQDDKTASVVSALVKVGDSTLTQAPPPDHNKHLGQSRFLALWRCFTSAEFHMLSIPLGDTSDVWCHQPWYRHWTLNRSPTASQMTIKTVFCHIEPDVKIGKVHNPLT